MKHLKTFENNDVRKVYWIVPFNDNFEDSLVRLMMQYSSKEDSPENRIQIVDKALGMANNAKRACPEEDFITIEMIFSIKNDQVVIGPNFNISPETEKENLDENGFIFVGFHNTTKDDYELYLNTKKYNL